MKYLRQSMEIKGDMDEIPETFTEYEGEAMKYLKPIIENKKGNPSSNTLHVLRVDPS